MNCKICNQETKKIFSKKVLGKYDVNYYQCPNCLFVQTDNPYWLDEAYNSPIDFRDIGLIARNMLYAENITALFQICKFDRHKKYLDYGGGYGLFVRMMRDNGYNFYWQDEYCKNLYVQKFTAENLPVNEQKYEVVTAFEVFEHLPDPVKEVEKLLAFTDSILFSTELIRVETPQIKDWYYLGPDHGQHIAFYHKKTLEYIANKFGLNFYTHKNLHFLTRKKINYTIYKIANTNRLARLYNTFIQPKSLLPADAEANLL
jgi:2-polyprenyl-3-methyl-5-hydroxy-6-metoxy-1,4-benzoquinol methylase